MSIRTRLFTGFLLLIVIFLVSFFVNQQLSTEVVRNSAYINRSESVIRNSNMLHKLIIDMQSGYRGYLLTSQESFLKSYYQGIEEIPPIARELRTLVSSEIQRQRLDSILYLNKIWVDYANTLITTKQDTLPQASDKYRALFESKVKTGTGKKINDDIRLIFIAFDAHEYMVRQSRRINLELSLERTRRINLALTLFSITLALLASFYIIRIITRRIKRMVLLADDIARGSFKTIDDDRNDELTKLSSSLNAMSQTLAKNFQELTKKNKELDQFAYVVSHDLKAPLRGIDNITTWIEEDHANEITPDIKKNLDMIKGRAQRLENMINGLLDYARIGKVKREREQVDMMLLLTELREILVPPNFEFHIQGPMPVLFTEKLHIEQVFSNLISNAVKYNNKVNPKIEVCCNTLPDRYEFVITDNGIGIQSQYFEKIFTIFQTLKERDAFESTGVGLAIVKRIIEDKKMNIEVDSSPGEWTTFRFTWPARDSSSQNETLHENYLVNRR